MKGIIRFRNQCQLIILAGLKTMVMEPERITPIMQVTSASFWSLWTGQGVRVRRVMNY